MGSSLIFNMVFGFFIIAIVFISLDKGTSDILINDTLVDLNTTNTTFSLNVYTTLNTIKSAWLWVPFLALLGVMYYTFDRVQGG